LDLRKEDKGQLEASHMRFLRLLIGFTRRDRLSNEEMRKRLKTVNIVKDVQNCNHVGNNMLIGWGENRSPKK
jgi:hypothetical protein